MKLPAEVWAVALAVPVVLKAGMLFHMSLFKAFGLGVAFEYTTMVGAIVIGLCVGWVYQKLK